MSRFNEGDEVFLARHALDSEVNLEIGYEGVVLPITSIFVDTDKRTPVRWRTTKGNGELWYVDTDSLELLNLNLENE